MNKLKRTFDNHPPSLIVGLVAFTLWVVGLSLLAPSLILAASICFIGAVATAMALDL